MASFRPYDSRQRSGRLLAESNRDIAAYGAVKKHLLTRNTED
jgi:hypothetical protein